MLNMVTYHLCFHEALATTISSFKIMFENTLTGFTISCHMAPTDMGDS